MNTLTKADLKNNPVFKDWWYHNIELLPGIFTPGQKYKNIHLTRKLLKNCPVKDLNCLDVGAQDCLTSILLERRGAAKVVAQDLQPRKEQVKLIKDYLGVNFDYTCGSKLSDIRDVTKKMSVYPFDVVVFSGVLYHVFDPFSALSFMRGLVREGGLFIVETTASLDDSTSLHFNDKGRFLKGTNYWQISVKCLDYILRFLRLKPLDCAYYNFGDDKPLPTCRIAIVCQAMDKVLPENDDEWMPKIGKRQNIHFQEFLDWNELNNNQNSLNYSGNRDNLIFRKNMDAVDLHETVKSAKETTVDNEEEQVFLKLNAVF